MLGSSVDDPEGIEGLCADEPGLGLLPITTTLSGGKTLVERTGTHIATGCAVSGYEMHIGVTTMPDETLAMLRLGDHDHGVRSEDGRVMGCYLHGLFSSDEFRHAFLNGVSTRSDRGVSYEAGIEATLDAFAAHLEAHVDIDRLLEVARRHAPQPTSPVTSSADSPVSQQALT